MDNIYVDKNMEQGLLKNDQQPVFGKIIDDKNEYRADMVKDYHESFETPPRDISMASGDFAFLGRESGKNNNNYVPSIEMDGNTKENEMKSDYMERLNNLISAYTDYKSLLKTFGKDDIKDVLQEAKESNLLASPSYDDEKNRNLFVM